MGAVIGLTKLMKTESIMLWNRKNHLLMHAMGANAGGQVGSVMAATIMLSILRGMGII